MHLSTMKLSLTMMTITPRAPSDPPRLLSRYFVNACSSPAVCLNHTFIVSENPAPHRHQREPPLEPRIDRGVTSNRTILHRHDQHALLPTRQPTSTPKIPMTRLSFGWAVFNGHTETASVLLHHPHERTDTAEVDDMTPLSQVVRQETCCHPSSFLFERLPRYTYPPPQNS